MALTIKDNNGIVIVEGTINATTIKYFKNHLEFLLAYKKNLIINIEKVSSINNNGLKVLADLLDAAEFYNKKLSIIGKGTHSINESVDLSAVA
ncbi:MAG: STAS domain-containing protein [Flaviramulus sp.]|nr:STAS domain-containing protein [Flaviramulus sp.]NNC50449.1 STAS domain-containing protein [Flaviramulus sp.]